MTPDMNLFSHTRVLIIGVAFAVASLSACSSVDPAIVGVTANETFVNGDYAIQVECTYKNNGDEGSLQVWSKLSSGGTWVESQEISLAKGETQLVRFVFTGPTFFDAVLLGFQYNCGYGTRPEARPFPPATATIVPPTPTRIQPTPTTAASIPDARSQSDIIGKWRLVNSNNILLVDDQEMQFHSDGSITVNYAGFLGPIQESGEYSFGPDGRVRIRVLNENGFPYHDLNYEVSIVEDEMHLTTLSAFEYLLVWTRVR